MEIASRENELDTYRDFDASGDYKTISLIVNGYIDFDNQSIVAPYIGAGVGFADVSSNHAAIYNPAKFELHNGSDTVVAFQLMTGLAFEIGQSWLIDVGVNLFSTTDPEFEYIVINEKVESSYSGTTIMLGGRFVF